MGADQISTRAVGFGEGPYGHGRYGGPPQVVIDIDTNTMRYVGQIVDSALRLLEARAIPYLSAVRQCGSITHDVSNLEGIIDVILATDWNA